MINFVFQGVTHFLCVFIDPTWCTHGTSTPAATSAYSTSASELDVMLRPDLTLSTRRNIAHVRTCIADLLGFGQVPVDSLAAIALICPALQLDAVDGFPRCVY